MIDVDLTLFHRENAPTNTNWRPKDRLNSCTGLKSCRLLEWIGWYNYDVAQRLLGHYRLFYHFKKAYSKLPHELPAASAYILQYRTGHGVKYFLTRIMTILIAIIERGRHPGAEIAAINRQLVNNSTSVLYDFLTDSNKDFTAAFLQAMNRIKDPAFLSATPASPAYIIHVTQKEDNYFAHQHNTYSATQVNIQPAIRAGAHGKEGGVFSKKQVLILFDLLSACKEFDAIDYSRPNKFEGYANLLFALTGKNRSSIIEELRTYHNNGLYDWHTEGDLRQLIITLTHLADTFRTAGFRSFAKVVDKKITQLRSHLKN